MPAPPPLTLWACVAVLLALAARSAARLALDRRPAESVALSDSGVAASDPGACERAGKAAECAHLAMALGMAVMLLPFAPPDRAAAWFFIALGALAAADRVRTALRRRHGRRGHALESHHILVALAMAGTSWHAAGMAGGAPATMAMAGMSDSVGGRMPGPLAALSLGYVWLSLLPIGWGLARAIGPSAPETAEPSREAPAPSPRDSRGAALATPAVIYACEAAMTVVTGLMLLM
jgi:Domain of unknown function (DUF5134)